MICSWFVHPCLGIDMLDGVTFDVIIGGVSDIGDELLTSVNVNILATAVTAS